MNDLAGTAAPLPCLRSKHRPMRNYGLFLVLAGGLLFFQSSCKGDDSQAELLVAYNVLENADTDNYDIYVMNLDGSGKRNITNHPDVAWVYYAWKDKLYFLSDRDTCKRCYFLYEMDAEGNGLRKVTDIQLEDSWMGSRLNGKELVVDGRISPDVRHQLFLVDVATGDYQQLTHDTAALHRDPIFTPDGRHIIFAYKKNRRDRSLREELWIMEADGKYPEQLTQYPASDTTAGMFAYHAGPPRWNHAEGFASYPSKQRGKYSLYGIHINGGESSFRLTDFPQNEFWHDWSPDGKWLAVEMFPDENTPSDIYLVNWKNKELKQLTSSEGYEQAPVFVQKPAAAR